MKTEERYYQLDFLLRGKTQWCPGITLATDEQAAIRNFLIDYSPSMGTIVAVHIFGDDEASNKALESLNVPMFDFRKCNAGQAQEPIPIDTSAYEQYEGK